MMNKMLLVGAGLICAQALAGDPKPTAPPSPENMNAQQLFNAATDAVNAGRCPEALSLIDALLSRPAITGNPRVLATVKLRRSQCLVSSGRLEEAKADIDSALQAIPGDDAVLAVDISEAHLSLGKMYFLGFDFESATLEFERANALLRPEERLHSLEWLAMATMFEPGDRSAGYAAGMLALADQMPGKFKKRVSANARTLHARALMMHGQAAAAYSELKKALAEQGGLTLQVNLGDVITRADLALAALLNGDRSSAKEYMAYTGAGRFEKAPLESAQQMSPPLCGGAADLKPDDMAIIQFSIDDAGGVTNVTPVYASRTGPVAAEFARAVTGWSWKPQDAKKIPAFFRIAMRVELRCVNTASHPDVTDILRRELWAFLVDKHLQSHSDNLDTLASVSAVQAYLAQKSIEGHELEGVPLMLSLATSTELTQDERLGWFDRARAVLAKAGAPLAALTYIDVRRSLWQSGYKRDYKKQRAYLRTLLERSDIAADHGVADTLRLLIAEPQYGLPPPADAEGLLTSVAEDTALAEHDPLRTGAWVRMATLQSASGNLAAARASYTQSGLSAQECSLVDATPVLRRSLGASIDFPTDALYWGFEGWVIAEFDIKPDGTTTSQRAVVAYPPLIFSEPTIEGLKRVRYTQTYRPEGGLGCGGKQYKLNFRTSSNR
jgi:tetratricopeptide (TPR) repeat protein